MPSRGQRAQPIGVFDSGVGGLTVLRALQLELPAEDFLYLGDTARLPYGTKSPQTVVRYALGAADVLVQRGVKALVIACNTASAAALPAMRERHAPLPVIGVVEPGAQAAVAASHSGHIAVIGTEATVRGGAYQAAIARLRPDAVVRAMACQVFVALAEEGWIDGEVARDAARRYLQPLFALNGEADIGPDTLVLGCTHFPLLLPIIRQSVGTAVNIVDSAATTARAVRERLAAQDLLREPARSGRATGSLRFLATDGVARFAGIGGRFLGVTIAPGDVELLDI
jgi:glutamate racemase